MKKNIILLLCHLLLLASCAKEIYTDREATIAKENAQKVNLCLVLQDVFDNGYDLANCRLEILSGRETTQEFALSDSNGIINIRVPRGVSFLSLRNTKDESFVPMRFTVSTLTISESSTTITLHLPVFFLKKGNMKLKLESSGTPIPNAQISLAINADFLRQPNFAYPETIEYILPNASQTTDSDGFATFTVPESLHNIPYNLIITAEDFSTQTHLITHNGKSDTPIIISL